MELSKFDLYDDDEAKLLALQKKKKNRVKRSGRKKFFLVFIVLLMVCCYFLSDFSKVKSIQVRGNVYYFDKDISETMEISYNTRYLLTYASFLYESKFNDDPLIKNISMKTKLDGTITIDVQEKQVIGYYVDIKSNQ